MTMREQFILKLFIIPFSIILTLFVTQAHAQYQYYLTYQDRWNSGWNHALAQARDDWESGDFSYVLNGGDIIVPTQISPGDSFYAGKKPSEMRFERAYLA
jgi:hypothetical protein